MKQEQHLDEYWMTADDYAREVKDSPFTQYHPKFMRGKKIKFAEVVDCKEIRENGQE